MPKHSKKLFSLWFISSFCFANSALIYDYSIPYDGAGKLTITNTSDQTVNAEIILKTNGAVESFWGDLGNVVKAENSNDSQNYQYIIGFKPYSQQSSDNHLPVKPYTVQLAPHQSKSMTFQFDAKKTLGTLPLVMPPRDVSASINQVKQSLEIAGKCQNEACKDPVNGKKLMGYYTSWDQYARQYNAEQIPISHLNTILYAFIGYHADGSIYLIDNYADGRQLPTFNKLRQQYPYLNVLLSFGGWSLSDEFHALAKDPKARANFAQNAVAAMKQLGFNGIDIDWEYPVIDRNTNQTLYPEDAANFAALLNDLRQALDAQGQKDQQHYYLTIAVSPSPEKLQAIQAADPSAWKKVATAVDYINLMSYDFHGAFDISQPAPYNVSDFMAMMDIDKNNDPTAKSSILSQYTIKAGVNAVLALGFKPQQIILGIPAYARMSNIAGLGKTYGLYQTITGTPAGEYDSGGEMTGVFDYKCIMDHSLCYANSANLLAGLTLMPSTHALAQFAQTPWGYTSNHQFLTYDDGNSAWVKTGWARKQGLAGVMYWSLSGDLPVSNANSLILNSFKALNEK